MDLNCELKHISPLSYFARVFIIETGRETKVGPFAEVSGNREPKLEGCVSVFRHVSWSWGWGFLLEVNDLRSLDL